MRRVKTHLFWLGLVALLSVNVVIAAAQESSSAGASSAKATVYVYRYKQFVGAALAPSVYCDDVELARMENGRYFMATLEPGKHTFRSNDPQSGVVLEMKAGEQYYMRVEIATGFMKGHGRLVLMPREQASYELVSTKLKPLDTNKVADKERVSVEEAHPQAAAPAAAPSKPVEAAPTAAVPAAPMASTPAAEQHPVTSAIVNDGGASASGMIGDQVSLGDAARQARQKKQQQQPQQ